MNTAPITGLIAATHTPFKPDGRLHLEMIPEQAKHLAASGVAGVFVCGTTGESHSLTLDERLAMAEAWVKPAAGHGLRLIVQVGHNCLTEARALARHAGGIGATIGALPSSYFLPSSLDRLVEDCASIAAEAPGAPFYYYDIPGLTGVRFPMDELLLKAKAVIPNLAGIKYSNPDLVQLQRCLRLNGGEFDVLFGCDEMLLAGLALGVRGAVGSTYNYAGLHFRSLIDAFSRGDLVEARALQHEVVRMVDCQAQWGVLAAGKAIMGLLGLECGAVRAPLTPLSPSDRVALRTQLSGLALFRDRFGGRP